MIICQYDEEWVHSEESVHSESRQTNMLWSFSRRDRSASSTAADTLENASCSVLMSVYEPRPLQSVSVPNPPSDVEILESANSFSTSCETQP